MHNLQPILQKLYMRKIITYFFPLLFLSFLAQAQNKISVSGTIKSKEGNVLPGASIVCYDLTTKDSSKVKSKDRRNGNKN